MDKSTKTGRVVIGVVAALTIITLGLLVWVSAAYLQWAANRSAAEALLAEQKRLSEKELEILRGLKEGRQAEVDKLSQRLAELKQRIAQQGADLKEAEKIRQQLDTLRSELSKLLQERSQLQKEIDAQKDAVAKQQAQKLLLSGQVGDLKSQITELRKVQSLLTTSAEDERKTIQALKKARAENEREIARLEAELKAADNTRRKLTLLQEEYNAQLHLLKQTQDSITKKKTEVAREEAQKSLLSGQIKELEDQITKLRQEQQRQQREISAGQLKIAALAAARQELQDLNEQTKQLREKQVTLKAELARLTEEKVKAIENLSAVLQKVSAAQAECKACEQRLTTQRDVMAQLKKQRSGLDVELATLGKQSELQEKKAAELTLRIKDEQNRLAALQEATRKLLGERDRVNGELKEMEGQKRELHTEIMRLYEQRRAMTEAIEDLNKLRPTVQKPLDGAGLGK